MNNSEKLREQRHILCYYDPSDHQANFLLSRLYGSSAIFLSCFLAFLHASGRKHCRPAGQTYPGPVRLVRTHHQALQVTLVECPDNSLKNTKV